MNEILLVSFAIAFLFMIFLFLQNRKLLQQSMYDLHAKEVELAQYKEKSLQLDVMQQQIQECQHIKEELLMCKTKLSEQDKATKEKLQLLEENEKKLKIEFENLANKIFEANSKKLQTQNQESLSSILNPIKIQLSEFKKKVEDVYDKESKERTILQNELKNLKELNLKMAQEATNLTKALQYDNKIQGNWGEMVLDKVLESSGLREGHEFVKQVGLRDDENKLFKPDVIVHLPDNRHIIIDAKTSLNAYNNYVASSNEDERNIFLKEHIKSIKEHIKGLSNKSYDDLKGVNSLDFIFMFVPIEGALLLALENDPTLYDEAFKQKIILVSPTTLLVALRAVENTWRYEKQSQNIADVYARAESLYGKFVNFVDDFEKIGKSLDNAKTSYDEAFKKLSMGRGNLINQAAMLKKISNIKPKKELDGALVDRAQADNLQ